MALSTDVQETVYGPAASDLTDSRLADLCVPEAGVQTGPFGSQLHQEDYVPVGTPIITVEHLGENRILHEGVPRVAESDRSRLEKYSLRAGDIVFSRVGSVDRRALVRDPEAGWLFSGRCLRVRPDPRKVDPGYLSYFFGLPAFKNHIRAIAVGATMPSLNTSLLSDIRVLHPRSVDQQRRLGEILAALDDKIELNRRMSDTLKPMARALFNAWLNHERPPRVSTADLIADAMLEIGDGYRAKNAELGSPGLPFIRAGDLLGGIQAHGAEVLRQTSVDKAGNKVSRVGDVAFTSKGTIGRFARVSQHTPKCVYSPQVCYWRSLDAARLHPAVLYAWMTSEDLTSQIGVVSGQTDMAPYVSLRDQRRMTMPHFPASQSALGEQLDALFSREDQANAESQALASIRDALLPKLISGELAVP